MSYGNILFVIVCSVIVRQAAATASLASYSTESDRRMDRLTSRVFTLTKTVDGLILNRKKAQRTAGDLERKLDEFSGNGCPPGEFRCHDDPQCISRLLLCDGDDDCRNGADESRDQCGITSTTAKEDEVHYLPGLSWKPPFKHYSGYLRATGPRRLHYWFIESDRNPSKDPLVLWLNGGPGCSSINGLLGEHGPFLISDDGVTLVENPYSWNKVANMLYLETPAGVGFSYSDDKQYNTSDDQVALDNHWALNDFFKKFPQFASNDFYITGESYAGMYVPLLAVRIMENPTFNLKGVVVGNGINDYSLGFNSLFYFAHYHGALGDELWEKIMTHCCHGNTRRCRIDVNRFDNSLCDTQVTDVLKDILPQVNIYSMYSKCEGRNNREIAFTVNSLLQGAGVRYGNVLNVLAGQPAGKKPKRDISPCLNDTAMTKYLNQPCVREALHIPHHVQKWEGCSVQIFTSYKRQYANMAGHYRWMLRKNIRVLIYNGDWDMVCPFLGAKWFVDDLDLELVEEHREWYYTAEDGTVQIAGFVKAFKNLTFATVKGAGHLVPETKPLQALQLFADFLEGKPQRDVKRKY